MRIHSLIENKELELKGDSPFAAILGISPSKGARSPTLWNKAFSGFNIQAKMVPMDVREENFAALVAALKIDERFLGGAVTMPFKSQILPLLDSVEPEAIAAGAVNCFYKEGKKLIGTNTDGLAALASLRQGVGQELNGAKALLLGLGGAGSAVAAYLAPALGPNGSLTLANRSPTAIEQASQRLQGFRKVIKASSWPVKPAQEKYDLIINATSLGFENPMQDGGGWFMPKFFTPLGASPPAFRSMSRESAEKEYLGHVTKEVAANVAECLGFLHYQREAFVYDIIYQPRLTLLLSLAQTCGCKVLNGLVMNLEQAVIAFDKTSAAAGLRKPGMAEVKKFMEAD